MKATTVMKALVVVIMVMGFCVLLEICAPFLGVRHRSLVLALTERSPFELANALSRHRGACQWEPQRFV